MKISYWVRVIKRCLFFACFVNPDDPVVNISEKWLVVLYGVMVSLLQIQKMFF